MNNEMYKRALFTHDKLKTWLKTRLNQLFSNRLEIIAPLTEQLFISVSTLFYKIDHLFFMHSINKHGLITIPAEQALEISLYAILGKCVKLASIAEDYEAIHIDLQIKINTQFLNQQLAERVNQELNLLLASTKITSQLSLYINQVFQLGFSPPQSPHSVSTSLDPTGMLLRENGSPLRSSLTLDGYAVELLLSLRPTNF